LSLKLGRINDMALMNGQPGIVTVTEDASINIYDYNEKKELLTR